MIESIELINFKCYKKQKFTLKNLTVFCGNNSVGKSTAIQSLLMLLQGNFSEEISFSGDLISVGSYRDVRNKFSESDSLKISLAVANKMSVWGYDLDDLSSPHYDESNYRKNLELIEEAPLPLIADENDLRDLLESTLQNNFQYLCAERWGPRNYYPFSNERRSKKWLGPNGEYIAQVLSEFSNFQSDDSIFSFNDPRVHENAQGLGILSSLYEWMSEISPGTFIDSSVMRGADIATNLFEFNGEKYRPINVGFGLSYSLPIVTALLFTPPGGLVIIENPEAHLHPRGQSYIGRLIALAAEAGVQVLIETHSDHVLNGLRIMPRLKLVDKEKIRIYQVSKGDSGEDSKVEEINVTEDGELTSWPTDFFDQQLIDMDILINGKEA